MPKDLPNEEGRSLGGLFHWAFVPLPVQARSFQMRPSASAAAKIALVIIAFALVPYFKDRCGLGALDFEQQRIAAGTANSSYFSCTDEETDVPISQG